ncbi:amidase [Geodermatophilus sp. CPCC 206100]|uniref:amidase n=1 Tax=Geodermatophilus sp. CPCC 206100 TaxID=3020054 RepID=UPI003B006ABE
MPADLVDVSAPSAGQLLARLRAGETSARALAEHHLRRIEEVDGVLNAVVTVDPDDVLRQADAADVRLRDGEPGALLGLPVTVKDSIDVRGVRTTGGSWARRRHVPEEDATAVARIRAAGAVVLGKTNVPELCAAYETDNAVFGRTNNPHDVARTSGGSSGGEAAAVAAGLSPLGLGSDGGGSIRVPAHYCGVLGLRPTPGRVPETGQWPPSRASGYGDMVCLGPLARSTADLALLLQVVSGPDLVDPYAVPVPLRDWRAVEVAALRVAVYWEDGVAEPTAGTVAAVREAAERLRAAGAEVTVVRPPDTREATELFFAATGASGGADLLALVEGCDGRHAPQFARFLDLMTVTRPTSAEWFDVLQRILDFRSRLRRWTSGYDVVLTPVVAGPAPAHGRPPGAVADEDYFRFRGFNFTHTCSLAGLPAAAVPVGVEDGLPVGVQVVANPWREDVALAVTGHLEAADRGR